MPLKPRDEQTALRKLSPFERKDSLIHLAKDTVQQATAQMLGAGRGNPNWIATDAREAFFLLGKFALGECRRVRDDKILAGMPARHGIGQRFALFLDMNEQEPGSKFLRGALDYGVKKKKFERDAWIHELTDAIIGDMYPVPDRMLVMVEQVVLDYLLKEMCDNRPPEGSWDLFAVEGGTAAMCYIFDSLMQNGLLRKGDTIALFVPTFTPYIEICHLERFSFRIVNIEADERRSSDGGHTWHYTDKQLARLANRMIKLVAVVNPSNPPSIALSPEEMQKIVGIVKKKNPDLMVVTDDVYGTFVPGFRSLMAELPQNTITVYSFSKTFGCTGWRLGAVGIHQDNIYDKAIAKLPEAFKKKLDRRYGPLTLEPRKIRFIDRMVADSRCVALNHAAGLSLPQQVQMCFFALTHLLDETDAYKHLTMDICRKRRDLLWKGLGVPQPPHDPMRAWYYVELDFRVWAKATYGDAFVKYMVDRYEPVDFLFRLAEQSGLVLMDGGGCGGPPWSIRLSLANLNEEDYAQIGNHMRKAAQQYVERWKERRGTYKSHSIGRTDRNRIQRRLRNPAPGSES